MNRLASLTACLCVYLGLAVGYGADTPAKEQPVYVYLYTRIDDHVNHELSEDRVKRTIANLDRIGRANPGVTPSCVFLVSGASSEMFQQRDDAAKYLTTLKEGVRRGVWEIGYDGENEPTHLVRPQPNFRGAKTGDDRWMARTQAFGWFLNESKHRLTGEPDPSRPGGLKLTQQVMGPVVSVSGVVTMELGSDSEAANLIRQQAPSAILPGLPESDTWPARNLDGYGGSIAAFSQMMSPGPSFAPEVYWQDGFVRLSNMTQGGARTVIANGGSAAFRNFLKSIDRSKVHVIKVHLGHPSNYVKPTFNHGELNPLRWAYENPKRQRIMDDSRLSDAEVEAAYAKETELLKWLVGDFFKDNPGSRFISAHELAGMVQTATGTTVSLETIRAANKDMLEQWREIGTYLPNYARVGTQYFSLSDMFYLLANTVGGMNTSGRMPESVNLKFVYGPTETPDMVNTAIQSVSRGDIEKTAAVLARQLHDDTWKELPANRVPAKIRCRDVDMNAAEFLRLMSEAMVATDETAKIPVRRFWMFSSAGEGFPRSRNKNEEGGMWTNKPAPLKLTSQAR